MPGEFRAYYSTYYDLNCVRPANHIPLDIYHSKNFQAARRQTDSPCHLKSRGES